MKKTIVKTVMTASVVAFTGCGVDGGGGGGSSRNLDINLEKGVRLVKKTHKDLKHNTMDTITYEYDKLSRVETKIKVNDTGRLVSKFSYLGDKYAEKKRIEIFYDSNGNKISDYKIEIEYDKRMHATNMTTTLNGYSQPTIKSVSTFTYKNDNPNQIETKNYVGSTLSSEATHKYKYSEEKLDKVETMQKQPNGVILSEANMTYGYDSLNRIKYHTITNSPGTTDEYITTYSKNTKTAHPDCYEGNLLKVYRENFKESPRGERNCYLKKSKTKIIDGSKDVETYEYKINDENLVTESKSERFIDTYEYEEY